MMNYEEFFKRAFADIRKDQSCPDNEAILNDILERAKRMEKSKQKMRGIINAAAGTAAAVAVVGGSIMGLNWLNEHGGLKEGGGAAYHEEVSAGPEEPTPAVTTVQDFALADNIADNLDNMGVESHIYNRTEETEAALPEGLKFEFDGFTVEPRWCTFDGMTLHMAYDVISSGALPADVDTLVSLYGGAYECVHTSNESSRSGNRALIYATICYARMNNEVSVSFVEPEYFEDDKLDMLPEKAAETAFTVTRPDTTHNFSVDAGMSEVKLTYSEDIVNVAHVDATYNAVSFKLGVTEELHNIALLYGFEPVIRLTDGTEIKPFSGQVPFEFATDYGLYIRFMVDTFDPAMIEEIYVNGVPLCNMEKAPDMEDGVDINDTIDFSDCTVNVSGIERYGNTVKLTLDAYAKENCDMNDVGFCVYEYHEDDEPENRVYVATFSDLGEADNGHLREEITFTPDLPAGTERTYSLRKYHFSKSENDETITFRVTGEDYNNIYSDDHEYVGNGIEGEEIRISSLRIDPLTISFRTDSFNFKPLADSFNLAPNFSVKLRNGETMTYDKGELTDDNGNTICSFSSGTDDTSGGDIRYIFIATEPIFDVNEIDSITILGAEIPVSAG